MPVICLKIGYIRLPPNLSWVYHHFVHSQHHFRETHLSASFGIKDQTRRRDQHCCQPGAAGSVAGVGPAATLSAATTFACLHGHRPMSWGMGMGPWKAKWPWTQYQTNIHKKGSKTWLWYWNLIYLGLMGSDIMSYLGEVVIKIFTTFPRW